MRESFGEHERCPSSHLQGNQSNATCSLHVFFTCKGRVVSLSLKSRSLLYCFCLLQVGDFGLSKVKHQTLVSGGVRGTLPWMAPELLSGNGNMVTEKVNGSIHS